MKDSPILIVDFDGTYLKNDFFAEKFFKKMLENPLFIFRYLFSSQVRLLELKKELLLDFMPNYSLSGLVNPVVLDFIRDNRLNYSKIVLVSASPDAFIKRLLAGNEKFDEMHGSTDVNLKGKQKLAFINSHYGNNFDYLGDNYSDIPIFKSARKGFRVKNNKINHYE